MTFEECDALKPGDLVQHKRTGSIKVLIEESLSGDSLVQIKRSDLLKNQFYLSFDIHTQYRPQSKICQLNPES